MAVTKTKPKSKTKPKIESKTKTKPKTGSKTLSKTLSKTGSKTESKTSSKTLDKTKTSSKTVSKTKTGSKTLDKYRDLLIMKSSKTKSKYKHQITDKTVTKQEYKFVSKYIDLCNKCGHTSVFNPKTNMCINRNSDEARKFNHVIRFCDTYFAKKLNPADNKAINFLLDLELPLVRLRNKPVTLRSLIPKEYTKHMNNTTAMLAAGLLLKFMLEGVEIKKQLEISRKLIGLVGGNAFTPMTDMVFNLLDNIRVFRGETSIIRLAAAPFIGIFGFVSTLFIKQQQKDQSQDKKSGKGNFNFVPYKTDNILNQTNYQAKYIRSIKGLMPNDDQKIIFSFLRYAKDAYTDENAEEIDLAKIGLKDPLFINADFKFYYKITGGGESIIIKLKDKELKAQREISISEDPNILIPEIISNFTERNALFEMVVYKELDKNLQQIRFMQKNYEEHLKLLAKKLEENDYLKLYTKQNDKDKIKEKEEKISELDKQLNEFTYDKSQLNKKILEEKGKEMNYNTLTIYTVNIRDLKDRIKEITNLIKKINETNYIALGHIINNKFYIISYFYINHPELLRKFKGEKLLEQLEFKEKNSDIDIENMIENHKNNMKRQYLINKNSKSDENPIQRIMRPKPKSQDKASSPKVSSPKVSSPTSSKSSTSSKSPTSIQIPFNEMDTHIARVTIQKDVKGLEYTYDDEEKKYNAKQDKTKGKGKTFQDLFFTQSLIYDKLNTEFVKKNIKL